MSLGRKSKLHKLGIKVVSKVYFKDLKAYFVVVVVVVNTLSILDRDEKLVTWFRLYWPLIKWLTRSCALLIYVMFATKDQ